MSVVERALMEMEEPARRLFGLELEEDRLRILARFVDELLRWNRRINLTSITAPSEIAELHILDSLAISPWIPAGATLLDVGTGGGFPGVPIAVTRPDVRVEMIDRTEKKILFLKTTLARLGIGNAGARHVRAGGRPEAEALAAFDVVVSRALTGPEAWFELGTAYRRPGGRLIAMMGAAAPERAALEAALPFPDDRLELVSYRLPSGARRALAIVDREAPAGDRD